MNELTRLKKKAKKLYLEAIDFDDLDCGRQMAEQIRPRLRESRLKFNTIWERIKQVDHKAPENPLQEANHD